MHSTHRSTQPYCGLWYPIPNITCKTKIPQKIPRNTTCTAHQYVVLIICQGPGTKGCGLPSRITRKQKIPVHINNHETARTLSTKTWARMAASSFNVDIRRNTWARRSTISVPPKPRTKTPHENRQKSNKYIKQQTLLTREDKNTQS